MGWNRQQRKAWVVQWYRALARAGIAAAVVAGGGRAGAESLTVERAVAIAREKNPELLAARQAREIARGGLERARYWNRFNPVVEGGAAQRQFDGGGTAAQPSASASIEVEIAGQRSARISEAERTLARVEAEIADAQRLVDAAVAEAYYEAVYLDRRCALLRQVEELNRRLSDASAERFRSGEVAKVEANLAMVRYSQSRKETLTAQRDYRNALRTIERLLGQEPVGRLELADDLAVARGAIALPPVDALVDTALRSRPDLAAKDEEVRRVDAETTLTRRQIVPNPTLSATYEEESEFPGSRDRIFGGTISVPLPLFDRRQADLTSLAGARARAAYDRSASALAVQAEVRDAYRSYDAAAEAVRLFESEAVGRIAENFHFIETSYHEGKIDLLQLVVVQNDLVSAQLSYLDSLRDFWLARVTLERAVGRPLPPGVTP